MKRIFNYAIVLSVVFITLQSCSNGANSEPELYTEYFFESKDSVLGKLTLRSSSTSSCDIKMNFDETHNLKSGDPGIRYELMYCIIRNDSIFKKTEHLNKYGEEVSNPLIFIVTFNDKGILNTSQLIDFVNDNSMVESPTTDDVPKIDKVTVRSR
jgi:hypothetical protein